MKIKALILSASLSLMAATAFAQSVVKTIDENCPPSQNGLTTAGTVSPTSTKAFGDINFDKGVYACWYCSDELQWSLRRYWVAKEDMTPALRSELQALVGGPITSADIGRLMVRYKIEGNDKPPEWVDPQGQCLKMKPAHPKWVVSKAGATTDRPTYPVLASGLRSTKSNGRVLVNALCDCVSMSILENEAKTRYCEVASPPTGSIRVSLCVPAK